MQTHTKKTAGRRGFTLFIAIMVAATLLLISVGIATLAEREVALTRINRESQYAFYVADSGIECALYWDVKNPSDFTAFATSTTADISCNNEVSRVGGATLSSFNLHTSPTHCTVVNVTKSSNGKTQIESLGQDADCDSEDSTTVQRAIRVTY